MIGEGINSEIRMENTIKIIKCKYIQEEESLNYRSCYVWP